MIENGQGLIWNSSLGISGLSGPALPLPPPAPVMYSYARRVLPMCWVLSTSWRQVQSRGETTHPDGDTFHSIIHSTGSLSTYCVPGSTSGAGDTAMNTVGRVWSSWRLSSSGKADGNDTRDSGKGMKTEWSAVPSQICPVSSQPWSFSQSTSFVWSVCSPGTELGPGLQT